MKKVCVLMSTYNGEDCLSTQIDSILNQVGVEIVLYIRDDGSKDETRKIILDYEKKDNRIKHVFGENQGFANSFMTLLYTAPKADFYAFSDQDDYWKENKLIQTISAYNNAPAPLMVFCNATVTDENLCPQGSLYNLNRPIKNKYTSFDDTIAHGCLLTLSNAARDIIVRYKGSIPVSHDTWVCSVCAFFGSIKYIPDELSLYRRHGKAASYEKYNYRYLNRYKVFLNKSKKAKICAGLMIDYYGELLNENDKKYLNCLAHYDESIAKKLKLVMSPKTKRERWLDTLLLKTKILINKY